MDVAGETRVIDSLEIGGALEQRIYLRPAATGFEHIENRYRQIDQRHDIHGTSLGKPVTGGVQIENRCVVGI